MDQDPPSIIQYGYADGEKVSPSIKKNTMMGVLIGAMLAIVVIVIVYLMNDTVMTQEDVEKKLGLNLLGSIPLEENNGGSENKNGKKKRKRE
jgi:capsular polysaccharide biosynthesis protein